MLACLSLPWEFLRLYQKAVANRAAVASTGLLAECKPDSLSTLQTVQVWLSQQLAWSHGDPCEKYYYAMFVDPVWEITPLMVLTSALARGLVEPAEVVLGGAGRGLRAFLLHVPLPWHPLLLLAALTLTLLALAMTCRYRLAFPLVFRLEPRSPHPARPGPHGPGVGAGPAAGRERQRPS